MLEAELLRMLEAQLVNSETMRARQLVADPSSDR